MIKEGGAAKEHVWWWYGWYSRELEQEDGHGEIVFTAAITISFIILRSTCRYPPSFYNKRSHGGFGGMGRFGASPAYQSQCHPMGSYYSSYHSPHDRNYESPYGRRSHRRTLNSRDYSNRRRSHTGAAQEVLLLLLAVVIVLLTAETIVFVVTGAALEVPIVA
jgi:hypothetical protein